MTSSFSYDDLRDAPKRDERPALSSADYSVILQKACWHHRYNTLTGRHEYQPTFRPNDAWVMVGDDITGDPTHLIVRNSLTDSTTFAERYLGQRTYYKQMLDALSGYSLHRYDPFANMPSAEGIYNQSEEPDIQARQVLPMLAQLQRMYVGNAAPQQPVAVVSSHSRLSFDAHNVGHMIFRCHDGNLLRSGDIRSMIKRQGSGRRVDVIVHPSPRQMTDSFEGLCVSDIPAGAWLVAMQWLNIDAYTRCSPTVPRSSTEEGGPSMLAQELAYIIYEGWNEDTNGKYRLMDLMMETRHPTFADKEGLPWDVFQMVKYVSNGFGKSLVIQIWQCLKGIDETFHSHTAGVRRHRRVFQGDNCEKCTGFEGGTV